MSEVLALTKRNCLCYFRDRASVFFSLLGVLIVILLYLIFLRGMLVDSIISSVPADRTSVSRFVDAWVMSGILAIVSVTTSAGALEIMIRDRQDGRDVDMEITSLSTAKISWSFVLSTFIVGEIMSIITFVIAVSYLTATGCPMDVSGIVLTLLLTIPASLSGSFIIYTLVCRIRSDGAFSGLFISISVLIGFLTGIYLPIGQMEGFMQTACCLVPATHIASLMRQTLATASFSDLMNGAPADTVSEFRCDLGMDLSLMDFEFTPIASIVYVVSVTALFFVIATVLNRRKG